jgi:exopolysaccharide biosynthesis polyprenyl glycosylphosphotransferase
MSMARRVLMFGEGLLAQAMIREMSTDRHPDYDLVGRVGEPMPDDEGNLVCRYLGRVQDFPRVIEEHRPDRVVVSLEEQRGGTPVDTLINATLSKRIDVVPGAEFYEELTGRLPLELIPPSKLLFSREFRPSIAAERFARISSFLAAFMGILILAPVLVMIAIAIRLESPGPALFIQKRVGRYGGTFNLIKFRSMRETGETTSEWVCDNGHRVTRLGRWLRKHRLDELPQLINVIRGDMNLVGPRPHPESNLPMFFLVSRNMHLYGEQVPYYALRLRVRPGITGWAQVKFKYANGLDEEMEKLRYDLYYVKHYSIRLDLWIILRTIRLILKGEEGCNGSNFALPNERSR